MAILHYHYQPPRLLWNGHLQTFIPALTNKIQLRLQRTELMLKDGDFLDLDWKRNGHKRLMLVTHGLEGSSQSAYSHQFIQAWSATAADFLLWNCRSCSGRMNRSSKLYYHGETNDLTEVILHAVNQGYKDIVLLGYSMGGSINTKTVAIRPEVQQWVRANIAISTPCELGEAAQTLDHWSNRPIRSKFLKSLQAKLKKKAEDYPGLLDVQALEAVRDWESFDRDFSAPLNGFDSLEALYESGSINRYWDQLRTPTLLINAVNDPILGTACIPREVAEQHMYLDLWAPKQGGHVYFPTDLKGSSAVAAIALQWMNTKLDTDEN